MTYAEPVISVLMGVYYQRDDITLLKRSISSILQQTFSNFEFLICDDGSNDVAVAYIETAASKDSRIRLIRRGNLLTLPTKLNACLAEARGELIARMDDDDYSNPERFSAQLKYLCEHPQIAFVGCNVNLWKHNAVADVRILPEYPTVQDFYFVQPYIHPTLLFRKDALISVGGYSEEKHAILCEDYDLLLRLYAAGYQGANLQKCLLDYTISERAKGKRRIIHRWNEMVTRYQRFRELGQLPKALPYIVKPLVVGMIPEPVLARIKQQKRNSITVR